MKSIYRDILGTKEDLLVIICYSRHFIKVQRINPNRPIAASELERQFGSQVCKSEILPDFYRIDGQVNIASSPAYVPVYWFFPTLLIINSYKQGQVRISWALHFVVCLM